MKKNPKKIYYIVLLILAVLIFVVVSAFIYNKLTKFEEVDAVNPYVTDSFYLNELVENNVVEQTFSTDLDEIKGVYLLTATYIRQNTSDVRIKISSVDGKISYDEVFPLKDALDNDFTSFQFKTKVKTKGCSDWKLAIESVNNAGGNGITLAASVGDYYSAGELFVAGERQTGDLFFSIEGYKREGHYLGIYLIGVIMLVLISSCAILYRFVKEERRHLFVRVLKCLAVVFCVVIVIYIYGNCMISENMDNINPYDSESMFIGELLENSSIEQTFFTDMYEIDGVYLQTATYMRENTSDIKIRLSSVDGNVVREDVFSLRDAIDNGLTYFAFEKSIKTKGCKEWIVTIESVNNSGGNGITLTASTYDTYPRGKFSINGTEQVGDLFFAVRGYSYQDSFIAVAFLGALIVAFICGLTGKVKEDGDV